MAKKRAAKAVTQTTKAFCTWCGAGIGTVAKGIDALGGICVPCAQALTKGLKKK
jgi:hypothetical protein